MVELLKASWGFMGFYGVPNPIYSLSAISLAQASGVVPVPASIPAASVAAAVTNGGSNSSKAVSRHPRRGMPSCGQAAGTGRNHARQSMGRK
jgi:hypothetical protein